MNFFESGYISSGDMLPYGTLNKVSNVLDSKDTCNNRLERSIYQVNLYYDNYASLNDQVDKVEDILDTASLQVKNRRVISVQFLEKDIFEPKPRLFQGRLQYEIMAQKDYISTNYTFEFKRGKFITLLNDKISNVTMTRFGLSSWKRPYVYVSGYNTVDAWLTTKSRLEQTMFEISMEDYNPMDVEDLMETIDNYLSYARIDVDNRRFTTLEWQGDSLIEIEPNLWRGSINYKIVLEKELS